MNSGTDPLAQIRFANAMALFDEFVRSNVKHADAATLRGLESRFALRLQIQPSYWSQIKGRSRQIGERLARQFEQLCRKPPGWMDEAHGQRKVVPATPDPRRIGEPSGVEPVVASDPEIASAPVDDDERFIVGLVLTYYRRHPQRARTRLLDLLGEVLVPAASSSRSAAASLDTASSTRRPAGGAVKKTEPRVPSTDDTDALWARTQAGVAPLKHKR